MRTYLHLQVSAYVGLDLRSELRNLNRICSCIDEGLQLCANLDLDLVLDVSLHLLAELGLDLQLHGLQVAVFHAVGQSALLLLLLLLRGRVRGGWV